ncbi:MAG: hypothetical protein QOE86_4249 [Solirubrobacteraceae bacterium]|nr:hypothetical protein [Solirubrobacteraceae bacterium]
MTDAERLARLRDLPLNYDPAAPHRAEDGWRFDAYCEPLPPEPPGAPLPDGSFAVARDLLRNYRVADPRMVRATYDRDAPLEHRDMLLELRFGPLRLHAGCRTGTITDQRREVDGRPAHVWGWPYMTLQGHVEQGQMDWEVWKWLDTGEVEFHVHAFSRNAHARNPVINLGFKLVGQFERRRYLRSACARMARFTAEALERPPGI